MSQVQCGTFRQNNANIADAGRPAGQPEFSVAKNTAYVIAAYKLQCAMTPNFKMKCPAPLISES